MRDQILLSFFPNSSELREDMVDDIEHEVNDVGRVVDDIEHEANDIGRVIDDVGRVVDDVGRDGVAKMSRHIQY
jgi:hypothetical protein